MEDLVYTGNTLNWAHKGIYCAEFAYTAGKVLIPEGLYHAGLTRRRGLLTRSAGNIMQLATARKLPYHYLGYRLDFDCVFSPPFNNTSFFLHNQQASMPSGVHVETRFFQDLNRYLLSHGKRELFLTIAYQPWIKYATPWMATALKEIGVQEVTGTKFNKRIVNDYFKASKYWGTDDSGSANAWCASYVAWVMKQHGYEPPKSSFRAKEWMNFGKKIDKPTYGAIGVKTRTGGGHVAFIVGVSGDGASYYMLGGNQGDKVCIKKYPKSVWETFVVPSDYATSLGVLPVFDGVADAAGSES